MSAMREIIIQVDEDEYEQIARRAREEGVDLDTYARSALTGNIHGELTEDPELHKQRTSKAPAALDDLAATMPIIDAERLIHDSHDEIAIIPATGSKPTLLENAPALLDGSSIADAVIEDRQ